MALSVLMAQVGCRAPSRYLA